MQCHHKESSILCLVAHKQAKQYVPTEIWQWLLSGSDCGSKQGQWCWACDDSPCSRWCLESSFDYIEGVSLIA